MVASASGCRIVYPQAVGALYKGGKLLHRANGPGGGLAWGILVLSAGLVYGVPALGIGVAYQLGRFEKPSASELLAQRLAHLTVASPSLFVLIGVILYLLHSPNGDSVFSSVLWLTILATGASAMVRRSTVTPVPSMPNPIPLSVASVGPHVSG